MSCLVKMSLIWPNFGPNPLPNFKQISNFFKNDPNEYIRTVYKSIWKRPMGGREVNRLNTEIKNIHFWGSYVVSSKFVPVNIFFEFWLNIILIYWGKNHVWDIKIWKCCCWVKHFLITFFDRSEHSE